MLSFAVYQTGEFNTSTAACTAVPEDLITGGRRDSFQSAPGGPDFLDPSSD